MLAYLFWHRLQPKVLRADYESHLTDFHSALGPDVVESASFRLRRLPFSTVDGYEDWYVVKNWGSLGELREAVMKPHLRSVHDVVAPLTAQTWGGLYRLAHGTSMLPGETRWESKPTGESYEAFVARQEVDAIWQRQLVLGPAPEFCFIRGGMSDREQVWPKN